VTASDLDRGWGLLDEGKIEEARGLAESELASEAENPDALLLLAMCCRHEGRGEDALDLLARVAVSDPEWPVPALWSAEILADELARPKEALEFASMALDLAEEENEFLDAILLKAGIEIDLGKHKSARQTLAELPPPEAVHLGAELEYDLAMLFLEAEDPAGAEHRLRPLAEAEPGNADLHHALGLCAEARGDEATKRSEWLRVLELDSADALDARLSESEMASVAETALHELPPRAHPLLRNVPILIADLPARDDVATGLDPRLLGLFIGASHAEGEGMGGGPQLTQILLFRKNLERESCDDEDLREQIRITLLHETGHFFGMSEEDLGAVGLG
jgi:predicted Zn-dependent protease with MMP-like domain/thioredoxin-like negative regulator of GroEL